MCKLGSLWHAAWAGMVLEAALSERVVFRGPSQMHAFQVLRGAWQLREGTRSLVYAPLFTMLSVRAPGYARMCRDWHTGCMEYLYLGLGRNMQAWPSARSRSLVNQPEPCIVALGE